MVTMITAHSPSFAWGEVNDGRCCAGGPWLSECRPDQAFRVVSFRMVRVSQPNGANSAHILCRLFENEAIHECYGGRFQCESPEWTYLA